MKKLWTIGEMKAIATEALQREDWRVLEGASYLIRLEIDSINETTGWEKEIEGIEDYDCIKKNLEIPVKKKKQCFHCDDYIEFERVLSEYAGNIEHQNWDEEFESGLIIVGLMEIE